jgi:pyrimidine-nucleoside phosphorylase
MNISQIIALKRDGLRLSDEQVSAFVRGFSRGEIPDYQMAALAMAIYLRGMDDDETAALTRAMLCSGGTLHWPAGSPPKVDKHSTGGVGDKVSLVLAPLLACCGLQVPMLSGRGLGTTGGTLDKLESIPGYRTDLSAREICDITERIGCVVAGATAEVAPADRKLYALRDVTSTVGSIPLITASIMSKKLAENLSALVLDVKFGSGAFMKSVDDARRLARSLVDTGARMGVRTSALLTDMNQPLGRMVGGAVEVNESLSALAGEGPADLMALVTSLTVELLLATRVATTAEQGAEMAAQHIQSGRALHKFHEMVAAQGGDLKAARPVAPPADVAAGRSGCVAAINTAKLGQAIIELGGGRRVATDAIDHSVGLEMLLRLGDAVRAGQPLLRLFAKPDAAERVRPLVEEAFVIDQEPPAPRPLIAERVAP